MLCFRGPIGFRKALHPLSGHNKYIFPCNRSSLDSTCRYVKKTDTPYPAFRLPQTQCWTKTSFTKIDQEGVMEPLCQLQQFLCQKRFLSRKGCRRSQESVEFSYSRPYPMPILW